MLEPPQELTACFSYPDTYKLEIESSSLDKTLQMFSTEILEGSSFSEAESTLVEYVTSIIEPVGWRAVWRSAYDFSVSNLEYDFIVEVVNVSLEKLEADVFIKSVILDNSSECFLSDLKRKIVVDDVVTVPLIELYTISEGDDDESFCKTAATIENVRFFMTHLSRPWDGEDDDIIYSEKILRPRLQLYYDMKNNLLPKAMITKIKSILKQGWKVLKELNALYMDMNVSDSEAEINEDDLLQSMTLRTKLHELRAKMEILENPVIRSFMLKKYVPMKSAKNRPKSSPVIFIVAKQFTHEIISTLPIEPSSILEFEHNAEAAFKCSSSGDKIFIFPGVYQCDTLGWLEGEIKVEGVGSSADIILEATGNSEVFLNSCSNVWLKNLCLKAKSGLLSVLLVHHGEIQLNNCIIDANEAEIGILLLGGSEAYLENCTICHSNEDGIQMRSLSTLNFVSSKIYDCKRHGVQVDSEVENHNNVCTEITILNSIISNNGGHALFLNNVPIADLSLKKPSGDFTLLKRFPWLKFNIEDSDLDDNKQACIGFSSFCKILSEGADCMSRVPPTCPNPDDLNCSALSDLLNEISFTDLTPTKCETSGEQSLYPKL